MRSAYMAVIVFFAAAVCVAADAIPLPEPARQGGMALTETLAKRHTTRDFSNTALSQQEMSDLLWAAAGVNRPNGRRVFPSALGRHDILVYVVTRDGVFLYDPNAHALAPQPAPPGDHRAATGTQDFVATAAVNLVLVQDTTFWNETPRHAAAGERYGLLHAGSITQNVHLFAASRNWSAVVRALYDDEVVRDLLGLGDDRRIVITQSVGPGR